MKFLAGIIIGGALAASILVAHSQTSDTWRYDFNGDGAVNGIDLNMLAQHFTQTYPLPGPCHQFVAFATPVVLADGSTLDGFFEDDLTAPPSRDYLTC